MQGRFWKDLLDNTNLSVEFDSTSVSVLNVQTASSAAIIVAANQVAVASAKSAIIVQVASSQALITSANQVAVASAQAAIIVQTASSESKIIAANQVATASAQAAIITQVASSEAKIIAVLPIDEDFDCRPTIEISHEQIHKGLHWSTSSYQTGTTAMNVLITAPSAGTGIHYHFTAEISMTGPGTVTWSKTPNYDATGSTVITANNNNEDHAASNLSTLTHTLGGVWTSSGTLLTTWLVGSSTGNAGQPLNLGGGGSHTHEWELGYSSVHLIRATFAGSCESAIRMYYYRQV